MSSGGIWSELHSGTVRGEKDLYIRVFWNVKRDAQCGLLVTGSKWDTGPLILCDHAIPHNRPKIA